MTIFTLNADAQSIQIAGPNERFVYPYRQLAYSPEDIKEVRRLAKAGVNPDFVKEILDETVKWMAYSEQKILSLIPGPKAVYANGTAGDPKTNKAWPRYGRDKDVCSVDRPGQVKSPFTGDIYGIQKPGEKYYDPGDGWVRPDDGKRFYFKGVWNSYVSVKLHEVVDNLAIGYLLTGEPNIAKRALMILDRMATNRTFRPKDDGIVDYAYPMTPDKAYLNFIGNLANERTVYSGLAFDIIAKAPYADEPSSFNNKVKVFENIRKHYFSIYEPWYLEKRDYLQNHALMVLANMAVQGVLFGQENYLRTSIEGTYAFLDGTINRDGDYYELAGGYGQLGRSYGGVMIALLSRYNPNQYENTADLPKPDNYPYQLKIGNDPRWYTYCTDMVFRMSALGHYLQYGDSVCDRSILLDQTYRWLAKRQNSSLLMISGMVTSPEKKAEIARLYWSIQPQDRVDPEIKNVLLYGLSMWQKPTEVEIPNKGKGVTLASDIMPSKEIVILRSGKGVNKRALFIRGGNNAAHGHDDQMAVVPYGHGMVLAGEYGYNWSGMPDHGGWGTRSIAHNMVTVNNDIPVSYYHKGRSKRTTSCSSYITGFLTDGPAQFIEMQNTKMWKAAANNMQDYRRLTWMIDVDEDSYYFADMFQVIGGYVHDYAWSGPYDDRESEDTFKLDGVNPRSKDGIWTLAALSQAKYRDVAWNKPGRSWGERFDGMADGKIRDIGLNDTREKQSGWNPQPGNGYGMIWDVQVDQPTGDWCAIWKLFDGKNYLRTDMLNFDGMTVIAGKSPSLHFGKNHNATISRCLRPNGQTGPLHSRFANVTQVGKEGDWSVKQVEKLDIKTSGSKNDAIAMKVALADGKTDYLIGSRQFQQIRSKPIDMDGCRCFIRLDSDGQLVHMAMQDAKYIKAGNWSIRADSKQLTAEVCEVMAGWDENSLTIDKVLPEGSVLEGEMILIDSNPKEPIPYTHNDYYYIERVELVGKNKSRLVFSEQLLISTRMTVESVDGEKNIISAAWPNELAGGINVPELNGRMIAVEGFQDKSTIIKDYYRREIKVSDVGKFKEGDKLNVYVAKPGDVVTLPTKVTLTKQGDNGYLLQTNVKIKLTISVPTGTRLLRELSNGDSELLSQSDVDGKLQVTIDPAKLMASHISLIFQNP